MNKSEKTYKRVCQLCDHLVLVAKYLQKIDGNCERLDNRLQLIMVEVYLLKENFGPSGNIFSPHGSFRPYGNTFGPHGNTFAFAVRPRDRDQ